jgi:hypothetical protein
MSDELEKIAEVAGVLQQKTGCAKPQNSLSEHPVSLPYFESDVFSN